MGLISNGTTVFDAGSMSLGGKMTFIKKLTASDTADLTFVNGASSVVLDSTYKEYIFFFDNIHVSTDDAMLTVGFRDGSTDYDATVTNTYFYSYHNEDDSGTGLGYAAGSDLAQSTNFQSITNATNSSSADMCAGAFLTVFNPSSTTFVKHWMNNSHSYSGGDFALNGFQAGYVNSTSAVNAVQFKMTGGNIDSGVIKMYGLSKS